MEDREAKEEAKESYKKWVLLKEIHWREMIGS